MHELRDDPLARGLDDPRPAELSYAAYRAARERYFARLRADAELRRLEAAWNAPFTQERRPGR